MTTCRDIIYSAIELIGELSADAEPSEHEAERAMIRLQGVIDTLPGLLLNANWCDKRPSTSLTTGEGERIYPASDAVVVTLPTTITCYGDTRTARDLARVQIFAPATNPGLWVYSATKGLWSRVDGLTLNSDSPFGPEDDEGLAAMLAVKLAGPAGEQISPQDAGTAAAAYASFRARFRKPYCTTRVFRDYV